VRDSSESPFSSLDCSGWSVRFCGSLQSSPLPEQEIANDCCNIAIALIDRATACFRPRTIGAHYEVAGQWLEYPPPAVKLIIMQSYFSVGHLQLRFLPIITVKPVASKKIVPGSGVATINCPL